MDEENQRLWDDLIGGVDDADGGDDADIGSGPTTPDFGVEPIDDWRDLLAGSPTPRQNDHIRPYIVATCSTSCETDSSRSQQQIFEGNLENLKDGVFNEIIPMDCSKDDASEDEGQDCVSSRTLSAPVPSTASSNLLHGKNISNSIPYQEPHTSETSDPVPLTPSHESDPEDQGQCPSYEIKPTPKETCGSQVLTFTDTEVIWEWKMEAPKSEDFAGAPMKLVGSTTDPQDKTQVVSRENKYKLVAREHEQGLHALAHAPGNSAVVKQEENYLQKQEIAHATNDPSQKGHKNVEESGNLHLEHDRPGQEATHVQAADNGQEAADDQAGRKVKRRRTVANTPELALASPFSMPNMEHDRPSQQPESEGTVFSRLLLVLCSTKCGTNLVRMAFPGANEPKFTGEFKSIPVHHQQQIVSKMIYDPSLKTPNKKRKLPHFEGLPPMLEAMSELCNQRRCTCKTKIHVVSTKFFQCGVEQFPQRISEKGQNSTKRKKSNFRKDEPTQAEGQSSGFGQGLWKVVVDVKGKNGTERIDLETYACDYCGSSFSRFMYHPDKYTEFRTVTSQTKAGAQEWSSIVGWRICEACYQKFHKDGNFENAKRPPVNVVLQLREDNSRKR